MKIRKLFYSFILTLLAGIILLPATFAQPTSLTKEEMLYYTSVWQGDRSADGRPKVSDDIIRRMK